MDTGDMQSLQLSSNPQKDLDPTLETSPIAQPLPPESYKLSDITPLNLCDQKREFFQAGCVINPQFEYLHQFGETGLKVNTEHLQEALRIIKLRKQPTPSQPLSKEEIITIFNQYVAKIGLQHKIELVFDPDCVPRTKVRHTKQRSVVVMRDPPTYSKQIILGVLNHQVGTHILRRVNNRKQKFYNHRKKAGLGTWRTDIQEGLAVLNQLLNDEQPLLFTAALRYYSSTLAAEKPFREVYRELLEHLHDQNQAWNETVRVKRSIGDTSQKGGFYKDQTYFEGALCILSRRRQIDFQRLFGGKVNLQDTMHVDTTDTIKPFFLDSDYLSKLGRIATFNGLQ